MVLDQVNWSEVRYWTLPALRRLMQTGAVALMNTRKPWERQASFCDTYATMSAGAGARGGPFGDKDMTPFAELTAAPLGRGGLRIEVPAAAWRRLLAANRRGNSPARPGYLGTLLAAGGRTAAVVVEPARSMLPVAPFLDEQGRVMGSRPQPEREQQAGWAEGNAHYPEWFTKELRAAWGRGVEAALRRGGPVLVALRGPKAEEAEDRQPIVRLARALPPPPPEGTAGLGPPPWTRGAMAAAARMLRADQVLETLLAGPVDLRRDTLVVMSIGAPDYRREVDNSPAWVVMAGPGIRPGLLTSDSTRRPGWVMTTDFAPTVLELVGLPIPAEMTGHPWRVQPAGDGPAQLDAMNRRAVANYRLRYPVTRGLIGVGAVAVIGLMLLGRRPAVARRRGMWQGVLLAFLAAPLGLVLVGPLGIENGWALLGIVVAWSVVVAAAAGRLPGVWPVAAVTGVTAAAVLADVMTGSRVMQTSALGYDPIIGARFYGIGNELMGMAVAAACIAGGFAAQGRMRSPSPQPSPLGRGGEAGAGASSCPTEEGAVGAGASHLRQGVGAGASFCPTGQRWWLLPLGLAYLALGLAIGLPGLGANWGGGLTAAAAFGMTLLLLGSGRLRWWHLAAAAGVVLATGAGLAAADAPRATGQTHVGHLLTQIGEGGWAPVAAVVQRKAMMSWKLLLWSLMGWPLLALLAVLAVELARPRRFAAAFAGRPAAWAGVAGGWVTAVAAALFNDSGVVAGATSMMVTGPALLYLALWAEGKAADG